MLQLGIVLAVLTSLSSFAQRITFERGVSNAELKHEVSLSNGREGLIEFQFSLPYLDVNQQSDGFSNLDAKGLETLEIPGNPEILTTGELIALPAGSKVEVQVENEQSDLLDEVIVQPSQHKFRCKGNMVKSMADDGGFSFNSKLYGSDTVYPQKNVRLERIGTFRDIDLYRAAIYPIQMSFEQKKVKVTHKLNFSVKFNTEKKFSDISLPSEMKEILKTSTINGELFDSVTDDSQLMLIITADAHKSALSQFIAWKKGKGLKVDVVAVSEIGRTTDEIQKYIQKYYEKNKPTYLLLVGNKTSLPTFTLKTSGGNTASDYPYTTIKANNDIPQMFYGRIVADNDTEVKTQFERIINYEKNMSRNDAGWSKKGTTIASNEGSKPSDKEYSQMIESVLKAKGFTSVDRFYQSDKTATAQNIIRAINEGRGWLNYIGHGTGTGWGSTNDRFDTRSILEARNADKLPVIIDVACQNGSWVDLSKCFGKTWVTHTVAGKPAGAVAYYGGTVNISWHPPAIMSVGIAKARFEKNVESMGGSTMAGQLYLIQQKGKTKETLDNLKWYTLFGDPSLAVKGR